jgi:hypothetical protein
LLNLIGVVLLAPTVLATYAAVQRDYEAYAAFGAILFFVGMAVYIASSRALPMLSLSNQYASAATDAQRSLLLAAGQAMLAEGQSRMGIPLVEFACLIISIAMLRGRVFSKIAAYAGILGNMSMIVVEVVLSLRGMTRAAMAVAMLAGPSIMIWYFLVGKRLLQLSRELPVLGGRGLG